MSQRQIEPGKGSPPSGETEETGVNLELIKVAEAARRAAEKAQTVAAEVKPPKKGRMICAGCGRADCSIMPVWVEA